MRFIQVLFSTWLSGRTFDDSSTVVRREAFLMAVEMARGKRYSLAVPVPSMELPTLKEFKETFEQV